ncbi:MAG: methionine ABC transporter permease [Actinomycetales bacterium]|uniref:methionine ABC transporter permease n=1 Tax=uncultured Salinibacterium sp. TaxID=459274 RepID=UPI0030D6CE48|tara:strand:- start:668 stop:1369 length:702 start_codon:yes stop_codon:yes gene_type:complete
MIDSTAPGFWPQLFETLLKATGETLYQVGVTMLITLVLGLALGTLLVVTDRGGILERPFGSRVAGRIINAVTQTVVNLGRSIPFIILMIALIPFTRLLLGSAFGVTAAIVPLTVAAIPFYARIVEISLREVNEGLVEAGHSLGATRWQLVSKVIIPEAVPGLIRGFTTTVVSIVNYSAIVGAIGGGGLGDVAIRYGHQRYSVIHIVAVIIVLVAIVQIVQVVGARLANRMSHR